MKTKTATILVLAVLGTVLAAASASAAAHGRAVVKLRSTTLGKVLVDAQGRTLYLYTPDGKSKSSCYGGCAKAWPPLLTSGKPKAAAGVKAGLLGVTKRTDGSRQVTYKGHPLYLYAADSKAGQVSGEDVGGVWYVLNAKGAKVEPKTNSTSGQSTTTTTTNPGYGYGAGY
jgi:predicted lipoprotein with Yx(FWY)xxD motif